MTRDSLLKKADIGDTVAMLLQNGSNGQCTIIAIHPAGFLDDPSEVVEVFPPLNGEKFILIRSIDDVRKLPARH